MTYRPFRLLLVLGVLFAPLSEALANTRATDVPWRTGMSFGRGFDTAKATIDDLGLALDPATIVAGPALCPFERKYSLELIDSLTEFKEKIGISAEAEIDVVVASASGKLSFAKESVKNNGSIYLMLRDERVNCHYRLRAPKLREETEDLLLSDFEEFRVRYGDRFLSTISTGGSFYAVLEIRTTDELSRDELRFKLKAKVLGVTVFSWGLTELFEDLVNEYGSSVRVFVNNSTYEYGENTESLWQRYAEFLELVGSAACSGKASGGYATCGFRRASFEDYRQLTRWPVEGSVALQATLLEALASRHQAYRRIVERAEDIRDNLSDYEFPDGDGSRAARIDRLVDDAAAQAARLKQAYDACVASASRCEPPETLALVSEMDLERRFPIERRRYPDTCDALRRRHGVRHDGRMRVYWLGDKNAPIDVYCADMATSAPRMFLLLARTSAQTGRPERNFVRKIERADAAFDEPRSVTSVFRGLEIQPAQGRAQVQTNQSAFVMHAPSEGQGTDTDTRAELVELRTCDTGARHHLANLSLQGIPWVVSDTTELVVEAPRGSEGEWILSKDRKQLDAYGAGRSDCVRLFIRGSLELEYTP